MGNFKNPGTCWEQEPQLVNDHDFLSDAKGRAIPYGIYDPGLNQGFVVVGHEPRNACLCGGCHCPLVEELRPKALPKAKELLILADSGGGNSSRARGWKYHLQHRLVNLHRLKVTVCHYPPGASKWNPIEHRLFSQISNNWEGRPLKSYEIVLKYIRTTKTATGLRVSARLLRKTYVKGETISRKQIQQLLLTKHDTLPAWNYTLTPM